MKNLILAGAAALALSACSGWAPSADRSAILRTAAIEQIAALNAAGIDPVQLSPERQALAASSCAMATTLMTVYRGDIPDAPDMVRDYCAVLLKVTSSAAPSEAPAPVERPDGDE